MAKKSAYNVVLIRSGFTDWDVAGRVAGRIDLPLASGDASGLGRVVNSLEGVELSSVLHGPDQCLLATAEAVARTTGGKLRKVADLVDVGMGLWEGLREQELEDKFPSAHREWRDHPLNVSVPEGEPLSEATHRLVGAIGRTLEKLRHSDPGVGIVLRPMSFELVRAWITPTEGPAAGSTEADHVCEWHELSRERLREAREGAGVGG
ncbi:MAG: histidine phosphatase family protein [Planctomycetota bacterium]